MKGTQLSHTTKSSDVCSQKGTASLKIQKKYDNSCSRDGVRAGRGGLRVPSSCRCPWQPQCLSPLGHRSLERALVSAPFPSVPLLPRPKKQNAPRSFRYWSAK